MRGREKEKKNEAKSIKRGEGGGEKEEDDQRTMISLAERTGKAVHACFPWHMNTYKMYIVCTAISSSTWKSDTPSISPAGHISI